MREISDQLCREHNLTVIEHPSGKTPRSIYFAEKTRRANNLRSHAAGHR